MYSYKDIKALTSKGPLLVIQFRQDRVLTDPIDLEELTAAGVVRAWPQSVTKVRQEGEAWLAQRLVG